MPWWPRRPIPSVDDPATALRELRTGDTVECDGQRWEVRGTLRFEEVGFAWTEYVVDTEARIWLTVEDGEVFEVSWWHGIDLADVEQGDSGDDLVVVRGASFRLQQRGTASYSGTVAGTARAGSCEYADYRTFDRALLGFENYGAHWQVALGRILEPEDIRVRPGR